jgi:hypothetical protein
LSFFLIFRSAGWEPLGVAEPGLMAPDDELPCSLTLGSMDRLPSGRVLGETADLPSLRTSFEDVESLLRMTRLFSMFWMVTRAAPSGLS